jgi:hypothetical protein
MCLLDLGGIWVLVASRPPIIWPEPLLIESLGEKVWERNRIDSHLRTEVPIKLPRRI